MFTNQSILETNADPYPSLISVIGQVPYLEPGQLFFYLFAIIIFTFLLGLMNAANTAFNSITDSNIFQLKKSEEAEDKKILALLDKPATLKAVIVSAQTILLVAITAIAVTLFDRIVFFPQYLFLGILLKLFFIAIYLLITVMYMPNVYAHKHHLLFVRKITGFISFIQWLLKPLIVLILWLTKAINKMVKSTFQFSEKEFDQLLDSDLINEENEEEQVILKGIANFGNISVKQIMRNRMDMVALSIDMNFEEVFQKIKDTRYSRIPIFEKNLDSIKGIIFIKDILIYRDQNNFDWKKLIRPGFFVPENKKIDDLLKEFRAKHTHIAIVVDEYGGTSGLVTLEDILEEIVGDISDEYDEADDELRYSKLDENNYVFDGKTPINDLCKVLGIADDTFDEVRVEADTIGGLVLAIAGRFLFINEKVVFDNFTFTIESADRRRVKRVKMTINKSL
jgi:gliding motility-associated protein GldE